MKKTLMAVAVLGAFAGSAMAANVTLYGVVDEGLVYTHTKTKATGKKTNKLALDAGKQAGNRWGLKGTEELGEGWKVGFILESGFAADDGTSAQSSRLFGRESVLYVESDTFGRLTAGRAGQLTSGNGSVGIAGSMSPFGTSSYGLTQMYSVMTGGERVDNSLTYNTPSFAGLKVYAQASLKMDNKGTFNQTAYDSDGKTVDYTLSATGTEGGHTADRYYALGATYKNAGLALAFVVDMYDYGHGAQYKDEEGNNVSATADDAGNKIGGKVKVADDGYTVTLGGSYDFEVVKAYLGVQYMKDILARTAGVVKTAAIGQAEGFGLTAGIDAPVAGGTFKFGLAYADLENSANSDITYKVYGADVGYVYPFSKRTNLYATAGYSQGERENAAKDNGKVDTYQAMVGLKHSF